MKKAIPILALMLLASSFVWLNAKDAETSAPSEPASEAAAPATDSAAPAAPAGVSPADTCSGPLDENGKVEPTIANEFIARAVGGHHECPEERDCSMSNECGGSNACQIDGSTGVTTDTGWSGCEGLVCNLGQTVHIKEAYCKRCPCCTAQPHPCVCPNNDAGCGKYVEVYCE